MPLLTAQEYTKFKGMTFIDPFDDYTSKRVKGTVAYEIYESEEGVSFDSILVPVGGGRPYLRCGYLYHTWHHLWKLLRWG